MENRTVLVVEDELPLQNAIKMKLEGKNLHVVTARSVSQALDYLKNMKDIAAVWLDHYLLGKEDGLDLMSFMKKEGSEYKNVPVFVVSNTASEEKVKTYLELGAQEYLVKSDERLDSIVDHVINFFGEK